MLLAPILEKLLNTLLKANPSLTPQCRQLSGARVQITFTDLLSTFTLLVADGAFFVTTAAGDLAHCQITTQLAFLPRLRDPSQLIALIRTGDLVIEGDILLLQRLISLLGALEWDIEEQLSQQIGDIAAHALLRPVRWARQLLRQQVRQQQAWIRELLVEVWRWLPSRAEAQALAQAIAQLHQQHQRLASRLQRLSPTPAAVRRVDHDTTG